MPTLELDRVDVLAPPVEIVPPEPDTDDAVPLEERTGVTIDELEELDFGYPFDLIDGKVVRKMAGLMQSEIVFILSGLIYDYLKSNPIGKAFTQLNYRIIPGNKRQSRAPDISFVRSDRLDQLTAGYPEMAPDMAIEVISPRDLADHVFDKASLYIEQGVQEVWLIFTHARQIMVYTPDTIFIAKETLASTVLAGFELDINTLLPTGTDDAAAQKAEEDADIDTDEDTDER